MRAKRIDANLTQIVEAFRAMGYSVDITNDLWDATIGKFGLTMLIEVKDGEKSPSRIKLTKRAALFKLNWRGAHRIVTNVEDVLKVDATINEWHRKLSA